MKTNTLLSILLNKNENKLGTRINELKLKSKDKYFLDKLFPLTDQEESLGENIWSNNSKYLTTTFSYSAILLTAKAIMIVAGYSVDKVLLILGLASLLLSSGPSVLLDKSRLEKVDQILFTAILTIKSYVIYTLKKNLCLSDRSTHEIRFGYMIYPYVSMVVALFAVAALFQVVLGDESPLVIWISEIAISPVIYVDSNASWLKYLGVTAIIFTTLNYGPAIEIEQLFKKKEKYWHYSKRIMIYNAIISLLYISLLLFTLYRANQGLVPTGESVYNEYIESLKMVWPILFLYIQFFLVVTLHQILTYRYMRGKSSRTVYTVLIITLLPYFLFYSLFIEIIPAVLIYAASHLALVYFNIVKYLLKIPSVLRMSGFLIAIAIAVFKLLNV